MAPRRQRGPVLPGLAIAAISVACALFLNPSSTGQQVRALLGLEDRRSEAVASEGDGAYAFLQTQRGGDEPVGWNPCRPVPYVVNPQGAPAEWEQLVEDAVARIEETTGLDFEAQGTTDDRRFGSRNGVFGRPRPVLIGWADADEVPDLEGDVAGIGGSAATRRGGRLFYVTGAIALDTEFYDRPAADAHGWSSMRAVLLHELAHVVGLDHVDDPRELMHEENVGRPDFGPGDLRGLARLGAGACA